MFFLIVRFVDVIVCSLTHLRTSNRTVKDSTNKTTTKNGAINVPFSGKHTNKIIGELI